MKRALIVVAIVASLVIIWLAGGRQIVLLVDAFATDGEAAATAGPFVASPGWLSVGEKGFELRREGQAVADVRIDADAAGRLTLHAGGQAFVLGARTAPADAPGPFDISFAPDAGDVVSLRVAHSVFAWPTPFELNVISGNSPSWKRNVYYTLSWRKADGAALEMTWRYEQWLYDDWGSPMMTREGATGLVDVGIQMTPPTAAM